MKYELEDVDKQLVETLLSLAQRVVDLQYDQDTEQDLQNILLDCADLFGIETHEMLIEESEDGSITISNKLEEPAEKKAAWTPTVITNDRPNDT